MVRKKGPERIDLVKKVIAELSKHPEGIWIRELARMLDEPTMTVYKYITTCSHGYPGEKIEIARKMPKKLGGNLMVRLKG
jgi:DNA invertase Pin-like site-specific DNA recombinase